MTTTSYPRIFQNTIIDLSSMHYHVSDVTLMDKAKARVMLVFGLLVALDNLLISLVNIAIQHSLAGFIRAMVFGISAAMQLAAWDAGVTINTSWPEVIISAILSQVIDLSCLGG